MFKSIEEGEPTMRITLDMKKIVAAVLTLVVLFIGCNMLFSIFPARGNINITVKNTLPSDIIVWFADDIAETFDIAAFTEQEISYDIRYDTSIVLCIKDAADEYRVSIEEYVEPAYYGTAQVIVEKDKVTKELKAIVNNNITV